MYYVGRIHNAPYSWLHCAVRQMKVLMHSYQDTACPRPPGVAHVPRSLGAKGAVKYTARPNGQSHNGLQYGEAPGVESSVIRWGSCHGVKNG